MAQRVGLRSICSTFEFDVPTCTLSHVGARGPLAVPPTSARDPKSRKAKKPKSRKVVATPRPVDAVGSDPVAHRWTRICHPRASHGSRSERPNTRTTASIATACTSHAPAGPNALVRIHAPDASSKATVEIVPAALTARRPTRQRAPRAQRDAKRAIDTVRAARSVGGRGPAGSICVIDEKPYGGEEPTT